MLSLCCGRGTLFSPVPALLIIVLTELLTNLLSRCWLKNWVQPKIDHFIFLPCIIIWPSYLTVNNIFSYKQRLLITSELITPYLSDMWTAWYTNCQLMSSNHVFADSCHRNALRHWSKGSISVVDDHRTFNQILPHHRYHHHHRRRRHIIIIIVISSIILMIGLSPLWGLEFSFCVLVSLPFSNLIMELIKCYRIKS